MASRKRNFDSAPKLIILFDGIGVIVENTEIVLTDPSTNKHPHPLDGYRFLFVVHRDTKDQLGKVSGLKRLPSLQIRKPERFRCFAVKSLTVF